MEEIRICEKSVVKIAGPSDTCVDIISPTWVHVLNLSPYPNNVPQISTIGGELLFASAPSPPQEEDERPNSSETGQAPPAHQTPTQVTEEAEENGRGSGAIIQCGPMRFLISVHHVVGPWLQPLSMTLQLPALAHSELIPLRAADVQYVWQPHKKHEFVVLVLDPQFADKLVEMGAKFHAAFGTPYAGQQVALPHYGANNEIQVSTGEIIHVEGENFWHTLSSRRGSSGSFLLQRENNLAVTLHVWRVHYPDGRTWGISISITAGILLCLYVTT